MKAADGFTLIEVLVGLVLVALFLGVLLPAFAGALRGVDSAGQAGRAALIAKSRLAAVGVEGPLREGVEQGRDGDWHWRTEVRRHPPADASPSLAAYLVEVTVAGDGQAVTLTTLRAAPSPEAWR